MQIDSIIVPTYFDVKGTSEQNNNIILKYY